MDRSAPKRAPIDWERVEAEYRAGQLSVREIGRLHSITHRAILKRAEAEGWTRNLAARVRAAAHAALATDAAFSRVSKSVSTTATRETVEAAAARVVDVVRSHRIGISRLQKLITRLFEGLERLATGATAEPGDDTLLGSRQGAIDGMERLAAASQRLITLERQTFGLNDKDNGQGGATLEDHIDAALKLNKAQNA